MTLLDIVGLLALAAVGWFLWDNLQVREIANQAMRSTCKAEGLLFLDDTVALESLRPSRDDSGRLRLRRVYAFQYSDTGRNRRNGSVVMIGDAVSIVDIGVLLTLRNHALKNRHSRKKRRLSCPRGGLIDPSPNTAGYRGVV